jgi:glutamate dehydrogenase (NAD(P)+)
LVIVDLCSDIFIPAALEMSINGNNAHRFECKLVVEAANGPTTIEGEKICLAKGIRFLPDVLCNAGGVAVSYFEWLKNLEHVSPGRMSRKWEEKTKNNLLDVINEATGLSINKDELLQGATEKDIVHAGIEEVMTQATKEVIDISLSRKVDLRTAAYISGINKIHEFYVLSGIPGCE